MSIETTCAVTGQGVSPKSRGMLNIELRQDRPIIPASYNYIGAFLTFRCPYRCSYCINRFEGSQLGGYREISGSDWIRFFDDLETKGVPITLQGGEPGLHRDFIEIVRRTTLTHSVDILTNLAFDLRKFVDKVDPALLCRQAPYAPIRVSYHPEQFDLKDIVAKVLFLQKAGFRVGLYGVTHPAQIAEIERAARICGDLGIDFRTKPFLGWHNGTLHGEYAYLNACVGRPSAWCECATTELLLAPDGSIHRCHRFLYAALQPIGSIFQTGDALSGAYRPCDQFGACNPCDVKIKNNRFQQFGHVTVSIRNIRPR